MPPTKPVDSESICPCGSNQSLASCCLNYVKGKSPAPTAEALMRSRYTAHALLEIDYLWETWSPEERVRSSKADIEAWARNCEWLGLKITGTKAGGKKDNHGLVSFVALYRQDGELQEHQEVSVFTKTPQGVWLYVDHKK